MAAVCLLFFTCLFIWTFFHGNKKKPNELYFSLCWRTDYIVCDNSECVFFLLFFRFTVESRCCLILPTQNVHKNNSCDSEFNKMNRILLVTVNGNDDARGSNNETDFDDFGIYIFLFCHMNLDMTMAILPCLMFYIFFSIFQHRCPPITAPSETKLENFSLSVICLSFFDRYIFE